MTAISHIRTSIDSHTPIVLGKIEIIEFTVGSPRKIWVSWMDY